MDDVRESDKELSARGVRFMKWCEPFSTYPHTYDFLHVCIESLIKDSVSGKQRSPCSGLASFYCWICLRGTKTMALHVEKQQVFEISFGNRSRGDVLVKQIKLQFCETEEKS